MRLLKLESIVCRKTQSCGTALAYSMTAMVRWIMPRRHSPLSFAWTKVSPPCLSRLYHLLMAGYSKVMLDFDKANEILFRLGIIYKQQGKYQESLECFDRILRNPPNPLAHADIWFQIGHVYEQQHDVGISLLPRCNSRLTICCSMFVLVKLTNVWFRITRTTQRYSNN